MSPSAAVNLADLMMYLRTVQSREGSHRYVDVMLTEVQSFSLFADLYSPSRYADIRRYHPAPYVWSPTTNAGSTSSTPRTTW